MQIILKQAYKWKKVIGIGIFLVLAFVAGNSGLFIKSTPKVLGTTTHIIPSPTSPAVSPSPTTVPITIINNIYIPTSTPQPTVTTPTSTTSIPTPTPSVVPTQAVLTPTPTVIPSPTPTPIPQTIEIDIDYGVGHQESTYTVSITSGETAWQAIQDAVGLQNLQYTDYGGNLGIFITGFNGVNALSNQYYDFQVNGVSASVGISSYIVANHDVLKFVLTSF